LQFAQFSKTDIDYRFYHTMSQRSQMVYRIFAGMAIPYGNATAVPFVRQYYAGGAEGMRGWRVRDLGPGSYNEPDSSYPNQTGDLKLEFNMEYRYDISNSIKGAYFVDIGNIWLYTKDKARPGAEFKADQFYKQFAIGTGLGLRFDMTYAVFRLDGGVKLRDPSIAGSKSWILFHERFRFKKLCGSLVLDTHSDLL
jgi:outer membrane protein assembly factor BamA